MGLDELNAAIGAICGLPPKDAAEAAYACARALLPLAAEYRTAADCGALWLAALAIYRVSMQASKSLGAAALYRYVETARRDAYSDFPPQLHGFLNALSHMPASVVDVSVGTIRQALIAIGAGAA